jgi:hypothetical protein
MTDCTELGRSIPERIVPLTQYVGDVDSHAGRGYSLVTIAASFFFHQAGTP